MPFTVHLSLHCNYNLVHILKWNLKGALSRYLATL